MLLILLLFLFTNVTDITIIPDTTDSINLSILTNLSYDPFSNITHVTTFQLLLTN